MVRYLRGLHFLLDRHARAVSRGVSMIPPAFEDTGHDGAPFDFPRPPLEQVEHDAPLAFYNEIDPVAAEWLRNLIAAGHIAPGIVDERDIRDIRPDDLAGFVQCHFFAGIGIWSHALRSAGWSDDRPVWTGSCPCQPFSAAGARKGVADERHLWPHWFWLIDQCRPASVLGEQVASKDGRVWLDTVSADLEALGLAFGASDLCAAGFGGAHIRQRLYFVGTRIEGVDDATGARHVGPVGGAESHPRDEARLRLLGEGGGIGGLADADQQGGSGRRIQRPVEGAGEGEGSAFERPPGLRQDRHTHAPMLGRDPADWLFCRDGKWRPVEPGTFPLADAPTGRVGRLRAYGNGLDAETAAQFITAVIETQDAAGGQNDPETGALDLFPLSHVHGGS
ncbi:DNA cytosine methyltransferase [Croceicoccus sp. YJ47]|nr:DNA cytosine methyltransferase [Croceicoccus sp. YJ47]